MSVIVSIFIYLALSIAIAVAATNRGRSGGGWFVLSLLISPILAAIFLLLARDLSGLRARDPTGGRLCPACAEPVQWAAVKCKHCGAQIPDESRLRKEILTKRAATKSKVTRVDFVVVGSATLAAILVANGLNDEAPVEDKSAQAESAMKMYVTATRLKVRLAPREDAKATNTLSKGDQVSVFEKKDEWARISRYYDGQAEGLPGQVSRWVSARYLSEYKASE